MAKKTPSKKPTAITKRDRTLSSVKNAADTSQMKRLLDAVGGLGAIAGPTPAAKRSLRRGLGFGSTSSRKSRKVVDLRARAARSRTDHRFLRSSAWSRRSSELLN